MKRDNMLTFMDAWLSAMEGRDPSEAIERQEKRGQAEVVRTQRLPKKINSHTLSNEIFFAGVSKDMDYEARKTITDQNLINYTRKQYEKRGIEIIDEYDDLFWNVKLPEGWEVRATDHAMWNELIDNKGRKRASFFYKAAFYDRDAFINFNTRYTIEATHIADSEDYNVWCKSDHVGYVKDGDIILYQTELIPALEDPSKDYAIDHVLRTELEKYMAAHYPDWEDTQAYWD